MVGDCTTLVFLVFGQLLSWLALIQLVKCGVSHDLNYYHYHIIFILHIFIFWYMSATFNATHLTLHLPWRLRKKISIHQGTMCLGTFDTALSSSMDIFVEGQDMVCSCYFLGEVRQYSTGSDDLIIKTHLKIYISPIVISVSLTWPQGLCCAVNGHVPVMSPCCPGHVLISQCWYC